MLLKVLILDWEQHFKFMKKIIVNIFLVYLLLCFKGLYANEIYFIDITKVLNESKPGSEFQTKLKLELDQNLKKFQNIEDEIKKNELDVISKKKVLSNQDYENEVKKLRERASNNQKEKQKAFNEIASSREKAKVVLINKLNPIIKKFMEDNKVRLVLDKQSVVLGDTQLEITDKIIEILNKELPSIKLN